MLEEHASLDALRATFADLLPRAVLVRSTDLDVLHERVDAVVDALKAAGVPPERVIRRVKDVASDADAGSQAPTHRLVGRAVDWAIARYFASDGPPA